ncbi:DUF421 domain-containing protein [Nocardioides mangrovicus]|uniref:DUF421 domain-containing protein n=1 Tax=Nocardioides mangrovicus TaxID=2478913 RepID=A0A3L8NXY8_9ACTN|nr:YetF domain-containing protein [Nocardioides mangrovicus]RLV47794.1 DUF421 domain-containing protein [Nocardioides mangrovicus]
MWNDILDMGVSVPDKIVRTIAVYVALAVILRLAGKRDLAQLNSFDLVVMLLLSNVVQNAVIGPDNSLVGGVLGAAVLIVVNAGIDRLARRSSRFDALFEGTPTVLARDGAFVEKALRHEGLRRADVSAAVRRQNATGIGDVRELTLDPGGALVVELKEDACSATVADVRRLEAKLDRLLAQAG